MIRNYIMEFCYAKMHTSKHFSKQWARLFELSKTKEWRELEDKVRKIFEEIKSYPCYNCGEKSVGGTPEGYACRDCFDKLWDEYENSN